MQQQVTCSKCLVLHLYIKDGVANPVFKMLTKINMYISCSSRYSFQNVDKVCDSYIHTYMIE